MVAADAGSAVVGGRVRLPVMETIWKRGGSRSPYRFPSRADPVNIEGQMSPGIETIRERFNHESYRSQLQ